MGRTMVRHHHRRDRSSAVFLSSVVLIVATLSLIPSASAADQKNVLILNSYHQGYKWTDDETQGALAALAPIKDELRIFIEYMGTRWVRDDQYFEQLHHMMKRKFRDVGFDAIILADNDALSFSVKYRDDIFGRVPAVFCGANYFSDHDLEGQLLYTGINETADFKATLEIALRLHPSVRRVVFINDTSTSGKRVHEELTEILPAFQNRVHFEFLEDVTMKDLLEEVGKLSSDSLILYTSFLRDKAGRVYEYDESISLIAERATVPIYGAWDSDLGYGIVGGMLTNGYDQGRAGGEMILRILKGEQIENIPVARQSPTRYMFDYRQLERFNIKLSDLPRDSFVINEPLSFYAVHKGLVWAAVASVVGLIFVVIVLLFNIQQRKNAERSLRKAHDELDHRVQERATDLVEANRLLVEEIDERKQAGDDLRESEQKLHSVIQGSPIAAFVIDKDHQIIHWNKALEELTGLRAENMVDTTQQWKAFYGEERPCMADLLVDEAFKVIPRWYEDKYRRSKLLDEAYDATDFFPELGESGKWLRFTAAIIRNHQGELVGAIETLEDITERKRSEEALQQAFLDLQELNFIVNMSPAIAFLWRAADNWPVEYVSENIAQFGYEPDDLTSGRIPFVLMIHADDRERVSAEVAEYTREGSTEFTQEYRILTKSGEVRWIDDRSWVRRDVDGRVTHYQGIVFDITERKQAEEKHKESQQQLADIINFLPDATFVIDREGEVIAWNRAIEEMTAVKAEDMLGKGNYEYALPFYGERRPILIDLVLASDKELEAKYVGTERKGSVLAGETYIPALGGGKTYLLGTASVLHDSRGNIVGAIESIRDITERRQAEEALVQAEEKYRGIFENAIMGIFQTTPEGRILSANPAFARILGYDSPEEVIDTITDLSRQVYVNPERRVELLHLVEERGAVRDFEVRFFRRDQSTAWIALSLRAVRNSGSTLLYYEGTAQDVTDRKLLESRLRQSQKMEAIGTLAGGIAHDFNNILAAIIGFTEMTKGRLQQRELQHYLEQVLKASDRARNLVGQILAFSRQVDKEIKPVDISLLVKEALKLLRATLPSTIEIRPRMTRELGAVLADPTQLHQVIMNLCTNAAHAMRERGGVLEVGLTMVEVTLETTLVHQGLRPGLYVKLTVTDTGTGIEPRIIDRIFDPFFSTKGRGEGTGLGLSVVYGIVKEYGGTVTVQSEPGTGSTFSVYLPQIEHGEKSPEETFDNIPGGNERVFFVDDEDILAEMGREMLAGLGYEVVAATSGTEALELFRTQPDRFDLVITDMTMPGITGKDLARELLQIRPDLPIILCTGFSEIISEEEAKALGIKEFLMKPLSLRAIATAMRNVLESAR